MKNTNQSWRSQIKSMSEASRNSLPSKGNLLPNFNLQRESSFRNGLTQILFLSKRGMSRSPLAREMMRSLLVGTQLFGRVRCASRGVSIAYDQCPIDSRMCKFSAKLGYFLQGFSRFATIPDLGSSDIIVTLDHESEEFVKVHNSYVKGVARPIGIFFSTGSNPYIQDPYERRDDEDVDDHYDEIVSSIEYGCSKLFSQLPALIEV